jgi:hypothetical protein
MDRIALFLGILSAIITLLMFFTGVQHVSDIDSSFVITFLKTPVIYIVDIMSIGLTIWTAIIDVVRYLFFSNNELWELTSMMWSWSWDEISLDWYWNSSKGLYVLFSIVLWMVLLAIFGGME